MELRNDSMREHSKARLDSDLPASPRRVKFKPSEVPDTGSRLNDDNLCEEPPQGSEAEIQ